MRLKKSFGASVRGPGHISTGTPNQDAWIAFHHTWGDGIVISDGLGSQPFSNFGSAAACCAVICAVKTCCNKAKFDITFLFDRIKKIWLTLIAPLHARECAATCLFVFRLGDGVIHMAMLGDGLVAAVMENGVIKKLSEDKAQGFSNITTALSHSVTEKDWQYLSLKEEECIALLLCTDGVSDDLDDTDGFVKKFIEAHHTRSVIGANRSIRTTLENWPTPKHSDDKTIACLCREEIMDD
jgi:serine/threonine protein phosphatase PrpC